MIKTRQNSIADKINRDLFNFKNSFVQSNYIDDEEYRLELEERIRYLAGKIFNAGKVFFESLGLSKARKDFCNEIDPYIKDKKKLMSTTYIEEVGEEFSDLHEIFLKHFDPFIEFDETELSIEEGVIVSVLENILKATPYLLSFHSPIPPASEPEIYNKVKASLEAAFPHHKTPTSTFIKGAREYKPDILLPLLKTAIEYKFARNLTDLNRTIDEILIDVQGYDDHPHYDTFYAVFYVKSGSTTEAKFKTLWKEKKFPDNWKPIFVEGPVTK